MIEKQFGTEYGPALQRGDKTACIVNLQAEIDRLGGVPYGWMRIYEVLLFAFYNPRTGQCFPSHKAIATKARCGVRTVRRMGKAAFGVLNFATPNSRTHEDTARTVLQAIPLPLAPVVLHCYDVHRAANVKGLTAQEMEPESIAADEIDALWGWLSRVHPPARCSRSLTVRTCFCRWHADRREHPMAPTA
jgi:hypothetical protein